MPATAIRPASQAQVNFINSLRVQRALAPLSDDELRVLDVRDASREIDRLKALPVVAPVARNAGFLADLPASKYAITEDGVLTFWEIRVWNQRPYLRLLVGAPGAFRRVKVGFDRARRVADVIRRYPLAAAQAFAREYTVCAVCCADLSDPVSVALGIGPVCRRRFGL